MSRLGISGLCVLATALALGGSLAAQVKRHQATGTVAASSPAQLVILKTFGRNQTRWNFAVSAKTKLDGKLTKGERVRIYYHDDKGQRVAEQIKILAPAPAAPTAAKPPPAASPPQR